MAKKMKSLLFDDGYESFAVNDDPTRIIRFNPADPEIINRVLDVQRHFKDYSPPEGIELNPDGTPKSDMERDGAYVVRRSMASSYRMYMTRYLPVSPHSALSARNTCMKGCWRACLC